MNMLKADIGLMFWNIFFYSTFKTKSKNNDFILSLKHLLSSVELVFYLLNKIFFML